MLDISAEIARRIEEAEALIEPGPLRLAELKEAAATGPLRARNVVAEADIDLPGHVLVDRAVGAGARRASDFKPHREECAASARFVARAVVSRALLPKLDNDGARSARTIAGVLFE